MDDPARCAAPLAGRCHDQRVSFDNPQSWIREPEPDLPPKFGPRALWLSTGSLVVGWLALVVVNVSGHLDNAALTYGCGAWLVVVLFGAYMWGSRRSRWEFAARMSRAETVRHSARRSTGIGGRRR
jgi:hypothetical protein